MPRQALFTKEEIIARALQIVQEKGHEALSARSLGAALGSSSRPIFTVFRNMEEVESEVRAAAGRHFAAYVEDVTDYVPAFKEFGLRLFRYARQEQHLFHYLFLQKNAPSENVLQKAEECLEDIRAEYGISRVQSGQLFRQMWVFIYGLVMLSAKAVETYTEETVSRLISIQFVSNLNFIRAGKNIPDIRPHLRAEGEKTTLNID